MAEEKKAPKPQSKPPSKPYTDSDAVGEIIMIFFILILLSAVATNVLFYINNLGIAGEADGILGTTSNYFFIYIWPKFKFVMGIVILAALGGIIYNLYKISGISREENKIYGLPEKDSLNTQ